MIFGIGVDLVQTSRMAASLDKFGDRVAEKVLTRDEMTEFHHVTSRASFLAKRFAAKEAMAKALGTGFKQQLHLKQIGIVHDEQGKPGIVCTDRARQLLEENKIDHIHLSISDEKDNALAFVVLESLTHYSTR